MNQKYPVGIETFSEIIEGGYAYVDKTEVIYRLTQSGKYFFLSRPRRFGKSLMLSTLQAYYEGHKELFDGLWLGSAEGVDWTPRPVLRLNFVDAMSTVDGIQSIIEFHLQQWEQQYGISTTGLNQGQRFRNVIEKASETTGKKVVILIDEYDKILVNTMHQPDLHGDIKSILKPLFGTLKGADRFIEFAILTGVSRFSKLSIFSDLNNLEDISLNQDFATLCGFTEDEVRHYFRSGVEAFANAQKTDFEGLMQILKDNYDGYHFSKSCTDIYNPYSLITSLKNREILHRWFESGTPTFLVEKIKNLGGSIRDELNPVLSGFALANMSLNDDDVISLLYQTGYLTVKEYLPQVDMYQLGIPNKEVETGLYQYLLPLYSGRNITQNSIALYRLNTAIQECRVDDMMIEIKSLLSSVPYELTENKQEIYYENNLLLIFKLLGFDVNAEFRTSQGRIDTILQTPDYIYILEFKLDGTVEEALNQIMERNYASPFITDPRQIVCIGINFSKKTRTIDSWGVQRFQK